MDDDTFLEVMFFVFVAGAALMVRAPQLLSLLVPVGALIAAGFLVFGVVAKMLYVVTGQGGREFDWFYGMAFLLMVATYFERPDIVVKSVLAVVGLVLSAVTGVVGLALH